jgi:hypothetical protein
MITALTALESQPALFVELTFATETARVWSGRGSVTWGGHEWLGLGSLMGITSAEDAATVEARGIAVTVSGLDPALLADALVDYRLGLPAVVSLGFWSGGALVDSPTVVWAGRTDQPVADVAPEDVTITIACESRLATMNVATDRRLTNEDQQLDYPGDLGLQFVDALQEAALFWGQHATVTTNV